MKSLCWVWKLFALIFPVIQLDVKLTYTTMLNNVTSSVYIVSYITLIPVNLSSLFDGHHTYMS